MSSGLVERHIAFLEALRGAGLAVSIAEDLDAVAALSVLPWSRRSTVRDAYAATLVKRPVHRAAFDALFDVYFPRLVGDGVRASGEDSEDGEDGQDGEDTRDDGGGPPAVRDNAAALEATRAELLEALVEAAADGADDQRLQRLAAEIVSRFGAMPGRGPGLSSWSAYTALQRVAPGQLVGQLVAALVAGGRLDEEAERLAHRRVGQLTAMVEADARRRIAEEKGPDHVAQVALRPSIDRIDFTTARRSELDQLRREIQPLARRLAARLTQEHHAHRRGPLDVRRTMRASMSTGGVPLVTVNRPKRPHRSELVVLCDVSGSVASFAQFTLLLVMALREQFRGVRAFTFVDQVHEVTRHLRPDADPGDVLGALAASAAHAARFGRTNYGRAFTGFLDQHADALTPRTSLLVLGDARSNYSDRAEDALGELVQRTRRQWWLNPEATRHWGTGDSLARVYGQQVPMRECRNLAQLGEVVRDIL